MATIKLKGNIINTIGELPVVGSAVPSFKLINNDLSVVTLDNYKNKRKILNIFPSLDTPVCASSVRRFNKEAADLPNTIVLNISADLPFAQKRFCGVEGIDNAIALSCFRSTFSNDYGVEITDSPFEGLCARSVLVLDENNRVLYREQVKDVAEEPNYEGAIKALK